jgi:hypothetical protein
MTQRPPASHDPTSEEPAPEFDGTRTDQLDDAYRLRVVTNSERAKNTARQRRAPEMPAPNLAAREPTPLMEPGYDPDATGVFLKPKIEQ